MPRIQGFLSARQLRRVLAAPLILLLAAIPTAATASGGSSAQPVWRAAWGLPMAWGYGVATNVTVRQLVDPSIGGDELRVRLSNAFGTNPVFFAGASVGVQATGAALVAGSDTPLTFGGAPGVTVSAGQVTYSDPVAFDVEAGVTLTVSVYVPGSALASVNPCCSPKVNSYYTANNAGNHLADLAGAAFRANDWGEWVDAVDVAGSPAPGVVVALGDSITEGFRSASLNWPEALVERLALLPSTERPGLINEGITANTLTTTTVSDALKGGGPPALSRLQRDVLSQPGTRTIILAEGTNDLWFGATAEQVIAGMQMVSAVAHQEGIRVVGTTILPRAGSANWTSGMDRFRQQLNTWIRTSGAFDGVADFARVIENAYDGACQPDAFFPPFDSGDHLHPDPAGETAMANAVDTTLLGLPSAPTLTAVVTSTPTSTVRVPVARTPGCDPGPDSIAASSPAPSLSVTTSPSASLSPQASPPAPGAALGPRGKAWFLGRLLFVGAGLAVLVGLQAVLHRRARRRQRRTRRRPKARPRRPS